MRKFRVSINGNIYEVDIEEIAAEGGSTANSAILAKPAADPATVPRPSSPANPAPTQKQTNGYNQTVTAQMPGTILEIRVKTGDAVKRGQPLLILEAMKMANEVVAPMDGTVGQIHVEPKDSVNAGDVLVNLT